MTVFYNIVRAFILVTVLLMICPVLTSAKVTGECYNRHTMHNSQDGTSVHMPDTTGADVGWNASNQLAGGSTSATPSDNLLVTNCVGCHSSSTASTTITVGGSTIPIGRRGRSSFRP